MRAFLAIPVQPPALGGLQRLRERLIADVPGVRWAPSDTPHITLHFFGDIDTQDAERALLTLQDAALRVQSPIRLRLHGLGSFPSAARPQVLWSGVDGEVAALVACARACAQALEAAGFPVERRPYRAHCTIGRPRQPWLAHARESWQRHVEEDPHTPTFTAAQATLFESLAGASGVRHVARQVLRFEAQPRRPAAVAR